MQEEKPSKVTITKTVLMSALCQCPLISRIRPKALHVSASFTPITGVYALNVLLSALSPTPSPPRADSWFREERGTVKDSFHTRLVPAGPALGTASYSFIYSAQSASRTSRLKSYSSMHLFYLVINEHLVNAYNLVCFTNNHHTSF